MAEILETNVVVLGGGPAGYSAAFRAADLGLDGVMEPLPLAMQLYLHGGQRRSGAEPERLHIGRAPQEPDVQP